MGSFLFLGELTVLTIHATHRDFLLTGYAHVQTHSFFCFFFKDFYKRYIFTCYNV